MSNSPGDSHLTTASQIHQRGVQIHIGTFILLPNCAVFRKAFFEIKRDCLKLSITTSLPSLAILRMTTTFITCSLLGRSSSASFRLSIDLLFTIHCISLSLSSSPQSNGRIDQKFFTTHSALINTRQTRSCFTSLAFCHCQGRSSHFITSLELLGVNHVWPECQTSKVLRRRWTSVCEGSCDVSRSSQLISLQGMKLWFLKQMTRLLHMFLARIFERSAISTTSTLAWGISPCPRQAKMSPLFTSRQSTSWESRSLISSLWRIGFVVTTWDHPWMQVLYAASLRHTLESLTANGCHSCFAWWQDLVDSVTTNQGYTTSYQICYWTTWELERNAR